MNALLQDTKTFANYVSTLLMFECNMQNKIMATNKTHQFLNRLVNLHFNPSHCFLSVHCC